MKVSAYVLLFFAGLIMITGCTSPEQITYRNLSPAEAHQRLQSGDEVVLLDVRTPAEHEELRIPGSLLIPLDVLEAEAPVQIPDKDAPILIYCRSGSRSMDAAEILIGLGYTDVTNIGGIIDWPYETEGSSVD
jgi:phage shock protein E